MLRTARTVAAIAFACLMVAPSLSAQRLLPCAHDELGVSSGSMGTADQWRASATTTPFVINAGCFWTSSQWGYESRIILRDARENTDGHLMSLAVGGNALRRIGRGYGRNNVFGPYASAGFVIGLAARGYKDPATRVYGLTTGVGARIALGSYISIRPEALVEHDFSSHGMAGTIPAVTRFALRIGVSVLDNPDAVR